MGCSASKLDNEDTVRRCKERRRLMKDAVYARHNLASAHADYLRSLRLTGSALSNFAHGEPLLTVSHQTPAVLLHPHAPSPQTPLQAPTPPQPPLFSPSPTIASSKMPHILSASGSAATPASGGGAGVVQRRRSRKEKVRLPHILSESSPGSTPVSSRGGSEGFFYPTAYQTYSATPSQASSVWNWENFYPPSPPDSEFFNGKANVGGDRVSEQGSVFRNEEIHGGRGGDRLSKRSFQGSVLRNEERYGGREGDQVSEQSFRGNMYRNEENYGHHLDADGEETETERSEYDFFNPYGVKQKMGLGMRGSVVDEETEQEEVQCSDWGDHDHYSTTSSSDEDEKVQDSEMERGMRSSEIGARSNYEGSMRGRDSVVEKPMQQPLLMRLEPKMGMKYGSVSSKSEKSDDVRSMQSYRTGEISDMKIVVRHKDLKEIADALKENFDKTAAAGEQVSEMLEIGRAQLDKSFRQLKKTVYHSSSIMSNLSSTWSSKPPLAVKYRLDASTLHEPGGSKSLCSTLERLLAWEKKLYEEVKARESVKIEHEKKLSALQNQEYRGEDEAKIDKTKTSIKKLQSLIIVTSQAVSTTSTAIVGLRDSDLVPQLVELCHGFMYMWKSMHQCHEVQSNIVQQVRGLVNQASKGDSTSELHRQATRDLESTVSAWHSSFCHLIKFQRDFIRSIQGWFKLTLVPVTNDDINNQREPSNVYAFCDEWKLALDRVPDTVASEAIKSFINVVHVISVKQTEELKVKKRTETASKELEKKAGSLRNIEKKFYNSYSMVGLGLPDTGPDNGQVLDARDPLAEKKSELAACQRRVEDEMLRHAKAVEVTRAMTLNNLQTGLPGVFQALTSFSSLFTESLETVCNRSYNI